jgi:hypothetical protein
MITAIFENSIERKYGILDGVDERKRELQRQRPKLQRMRASGMFLYFLRPNSNEIDSFYLFCRAIIKKVSIPGVYAG